MDLTWVHSRRLIVFSFALAHFMVASKTHTHVHANAHRAVCTHVHVCTHLGSVSRTNTPVRTHDRAQTYIHAFARRVTLKHAHSLTHERARFYAMGRTLSLVRRFPSVGDIYSSISEKTFSAKKLAYNRRPSSFFVGRLASFPVSSLPGS